MCNIRYTQSRYLTVLFVVLLALALRWRAVLMLPVDYDEPVYLEAAAQFASAIRARDWPRLLANRHTLEHPALVKLLYAIGLLARAPDSTPSTTGTLSSSSGIEQTVSRAQIGRIPLAVARSISLAFGVLQVGLLTLLNPIAGFFLAIHSMTIKYTSTKDSRNDSPLA
jgi:hypothetical protein